MENEVHRMSGNTSHDVIIAVVNKGNSQELVEAAKAAGARGGTVLNGRRTGMGGAANIFGMPIQAEKEIVAIIVSREIKHNVMKAINESFGFHNEAHGIVFSMPVDSVTGIEQ
ncbi:MAG: P-II family nitrogen regulator [Clostridiales bacterium]|nr:P-II family nitrogen regulator [Clostridiales bacterium]